MCLHDNSSIGDQIASRAMILKNDKQAKSIVNGWVESKQDFRFSDDILDQIAVNGQFLELVGSHAVHQGGLIMSRICMNLQLCFYIR